MWGLFDTWHGQHSGLGLTLVVCVLASLFGSWVVSNKRSRRVRSLVESGWRLAFRCVDDAVILVDRSGVVQFANIAAVELLGAQGIEVGSVRLEKLVMLIDESTRERLEMHLERVIVDGTTAHRLTPALLQRQGGEEQPVCVSISPLGAVAGDHRFAMILIRDEADQKAAEQSLLDACRRRDEFLAMLAFELRTPLAGARTALEGIGLAADVREANNSARLISRQIDSMSNLVDDLLEISRMTCGAIRLERKLVDLREASVRALEVICPEAEAKQLQIEERIDAGPHWVMADPARLEQLLLILLRNAVKYTSSGGTIRLEVAVESDSFRFRVTDSGIGIAPEQLPRLFDVFARGTSPMRDTKFGIGLGLTLAKRLVELFGGSINARSAGKAKGSEFTLRLPAAPPETLADTLPLPPNGPSSLRVLVVDDNKDMADCVATVLGLLGHTVELAHDGLEAVANTLEFRPDVVLLDIGLPLIDGYEVAKRLREELGEKTPRMFAMSGYGREVSQTRSVQAGFEDHFVKPLDLDVLNRRLAVFCN